MSDSSEDFAKLNVMRTFVLPALWVFLLPVLSWLFFLHAQTRFDDEFREGILKTVQSDPTLSAEEREAAIAFYNKVPASELILVDEIAEQADSQTCFNYFTFRWAIRLSALSVIGGIVVFLLGVICVLLSARSPKMQYWSLAAGWHVLRIYSAAQAVIQGALLVALSFWVTALWMNFYSIRLIGIAGILALCAVGAVIHAIFKKVDVDFTVDGDVIPADREMPLWDELRTICEKVGTDPPDQIIAGIDASFYVTEHPVTVGQKTYHGRTLYVSLSLLKQFDGEEADAVLAHEMAHFSGQDTLYSRRITPLLTRYNHYLVALHDGAVTLPTFYFMNCFRGLFELSLSRLSRQREFRADRIAVETTSPRALAASLLRIVAYAEYRNSIQEKMFGQDFELEAANVGEQVEQGFPQFAQSFLATADLDKLETEHPFDSHPPISQRLGAAGVSPTDSDEQPLLATAGDGRWYGYITDAEAMETRQWSEYEEQFRKFHEQSLAYRFLPESDEELEIVERAFPAVTFESRKGAIAMDHGTVEVSGWGEPLSWADVENCVVDDGVLKIHTKASGKSAREIKMSWFKGVPERQEFLGAFEAYYSRYASAAAYQEHKKNEASASEDTTE